MTDSSKGPEAAFASWTETHSRFFIRLGAFCAICWTLMYFQFTVDDAYISFRYGHILRDAHTWNWNPTGARVEAYTSAVYTILSIVPAFLHLSVALFFKFFGLGCVAIMVIRLWTESRSRFASVLGTLLLGLDPWVWIHAYSGLETPLYMLLILEMLLCVRDAPRRASYYIYFVALLLPLTRPEGVLFACAGLLLFWQRSSYGRRHLAGFVVAAVCGLAYFAIRWKYFGHMLPNPFYVKVGGSSMHETLASLASNLSWSKGYIFIVVLIALLSTMVYMRVFALCGLGLMLFLFAPHNMMMNYSDRFYFQLALPIVLLFLIVEDVAGISRIASMLAAVLLLAITFKDIATGLVYFPDLLYAHVDLGKRLAPYAKGHTLLIGDAGAVPYYSNWVTYDYLGLCTDSIAKDGISVHLLSALHPDLIVVYSSKPSPDLLNLPSHPGIERPQEVVLDYIRQSGKYEFAGASKWGDEYLVEFLRRDTLDRQSILSALEANSKVSQNSHISMRALLLQQYVPWSQ